MTTPDQLDGLLQGHRPGQLARGGAEHVGADRLRGVRLPEPLDEGGDARLGDQATQDRFSAGIARYHGSTSSMRAIAAEASVPMLASRRRMVAAERFGIGPA